MPVGYDDPAGGLPPAPDLSAWPPAHWFSAPPGASPLDQPPAPLAAGAAGPQPEGAPLPAPPPMAAPMPAPPAAESPSSGVPLPFGASAPPPVAFGPQLPATVAEMPDVTVSNEAVTPPPVGPADFVKPGDPSAPLQFDREDRAVNPFGNEPDRQAYLNNLRRTDPQSFAELQARDAIERQKIIDTARTRAINEDYEQQQRNYAAFQQASAITRAKSAQLEADAQRVAQTKLDPTGGVHGVRRVAGVLAAIVGGLVQSRAGGRNSGLDALNETVNRGIDAQRADLANQRDAIGMRRSALANEFAQNGDAYHSAEVMRLAAYKHADALLAQQAQDYDPAGATALKIADLRAGVAAQQQQVKGAYDQQTFKNALELSKAKLEQDKLNEERRKNMADEAAKLAKVKGAGIGAGAGAGGNANPNYTVATGVFDPFTGDPIMGKRALSAKGEKSEERVTNAEVRTYGAVQNYWAKLKDLGERIGDAKKTLSESAWKARRGTLESEYDAAKEALTVFLTKELGDKLTQGQLEAQAHRIPDRASVFEARDPIKQIADAQEDADRDFATDMNTIGINAEPTIRRAQAMRAQHPTPDAESEVESARVALSNATSPSEAKDAQASVDRAQQRLQQEVAAQQSRDADIVTANKLPAPPEALPVVKSRPAEEVASVIEANRLMHRYGEMRNEFLAAQDSTAHLKGLKQPGDIAAANHAHEAKIGELAGQVVKAQKAADESLNKAHAIVAHNHLSEHTAAARRLTGSDDPAAVRKTIEDPALRELIENQQDQAPSPRPDNTVLDPTIDYAAPFAPHPDRARAETPPPMRPRR